MFTSRGITSLSSSNQEHQAIYSINGTCDTTLVRTCENSWGLASSGWGLPQLDGSPMGSSQQMPERTFRSERNGPTSQKIGMCKSCRLIKPSTWRLLKAFWIPGRFDSSRVDAASFDSRKLRWEESTGVRSTRPEWRYLRLPGTVATCQASVDTAVGSSASPDPFKVPENTPIRSKLHIDGGPDTADGISSCL